MLVRMFAMTAALAAAASPCFAADFGDSGARRSGAVLGAYLKLALDAPAASDRAPRAGFRLAMTHDYRSAAAPTARVVEADGVDLRLTGVRQPTLYIAGRAVTGAAAKLEASEGGGGRLDAIMIGSAVLLAGAAGFVVVSSLD